MADAAAHHDGALLFEALRGISKGRQTELKAAYNTALAQAHQALEQTVEAMELAAARLAQKLLATEAPTRSLQSELRGSADGHAAAVAALRDEHWRAVEEAEWKAQQDRI